jgi:hypothetical protein
VTRFSSEDVTVVETVVSEPTPRRRPRHRVTQALWAKFTT